MPALYDGHTPLIPSLHQPALVLDHAATHDVDPAELLAGLPALPLGPDAFDRHPIALSPRAWLQLLARAERRLGAPDTAFAIGRLLLPGHYGAASHALQSATCLRDALDTLVRHRTRLSPLLVPRLVAEDDLAVLVWTDAVGLGGQRAFVVDMAMTAVAAMVQWLAGMRVPWTFCFNRGAPLRIEQHEAYLGTSLRFGCLLDAMLVPADWLDRPWPAAASAAPARAAARRAADHGEDAPQSLLGALHDRLVATLSAVPSLDDCATALALSPATLKRRLAAEGTHFQAELDLMRSHMALYHYRFRGADNAAVARALGFHDVPNYRRSFKRWTGITPQSLRLTLFGIG